MALSVLSLLFGSDLSRLELQLKEMNMKLNELPNALHGIVEQLVKSKQEILTKLDALQVELANSELTDEAVTALDELRAAAQAQDDIVPDAMV